MVVVPKKGDQGCLEFLRKSHRGAAQLEVGLCDGDPFHLVLRYPGVGQNQDDGGRTHQQRDPCHPDRGPFIVQYVPDASLGVLLPKGQGHRLGQLAAVSQVQQGGGVLGGVLGAKAPDDGLVAGGLQIPAEQAVGQPEKGVAPVQAQRQPGQGLGQVIPPPQVGLLVEKDVGPVLGVQPHGEIDFRGENTADKGGGNLIGLIEVAL